MSLITAHAKDMTSLESQNDEGATPLMLACQKESEEKVKTLLSKKVSTTTRDYSGKTALHYCVENDTPNIASSLLDAQPDLVNMQDNDGYSALHLAIIAGNQPLVERLLKKGADVSAVDNEGHTTIHWATVCGQVALIDVLAENGADLSKADSHGAYPVHYAAQMCGSASENSDPETGMAVLQKLLGKNVPLDVADHEGRQPLLWAASSASADACKVLFDAGASLEATDRDGLTALHCAASRGYNDVTEVLLEHKVKADAQDKNGCTPLFYALTLGHNECAETLLKNGANASHEDTRKRSPAHCAAAKGNIDSLKLLLKYKGDIWLQNMKGERPVHEAALAKQNETVAFILGQSKDKKSVDVTNQDGRTCLHIAALTNNVELCNLLLEKNANPQPVMTGKDNQKLTPYDAALLKGNAEVTEVIRKHLNEKPGSKQNESAKEEKENGNESKEEDKNGEKKGKKKGQKQQKDQKGKQKNQKNKQKGKEDKEKEKDGKDKAVKGKDDDTEKEKDGKDKAGKGKDDDKEKEKDGKDKAGKGKDDDKKERGQEEEKEQVGIEKQEGKEKEDEGKDEKESEKRANDKEMDTKQQNEQVDAVPTKDNKEGNAGDKEEANLNDSDFFENNEASKAAGAAVSGASDDADNGKDGSSKVKTEKVKNDDHDNKENGDEVETGQNDTDEPDNKDNDATGAKDEDTEHDKAAASDSHSSQRDFRNSSPDSKKDQEINKRPEIKKAKTGIVLGGLSRSNTKLKPGNNGIKKPSKNRQRAKLKDVVRRNTLPVDKTRSKGSPQSLSISRPRTTSDEKMSSGSSESGYISPKRPKKLPRIRKPYKHEIQELVRIFESKSLAGSEINRSRKLTMYNTYKGNTDESELVQNLVEDYNLRAREKSQDTFNRVEDWENYLKDVIYQAEADEKAMKTGWREEDRRVQRKRNKKQCLFPDIQGPRGQRVTNKSSADRGTALPKINPKNQPARSYSSSPSQK